MDRVVHQLTNWNKELVVSRTAPMQNIDNFDALQDARRIRRLGQNYKWDACKRSLEENNDIDENYKAHLLFLLNSADSEMHERLRIRGREDVIDVDAEEDRNNEYDPQYEHFFAKLKKSRNSYVLEDNINGKPSFVKYKRASTLKDESKSVSGRNKRKIKQIYRLTNQEHGLENDLALERQKACELQAQLGKKGSSRSSTRLVNPIKKKNLINLENEFLNKKPDHKNNQLARTLHGYGVQSQSSAGILHKNPGLRNPMVTTKLYQHDSEARSSKKHNGLGISCKNPRLRNTMVITKLYQHDSQARSIGEDNELGISSKNPVLRNTMGITKVYQHDSHARSITEDNGLGISCKNPVLRNPMVITNVYQRDSQARSSKKDNEQIYFRKVSPTQDGIKGKNLLPDLAEKDKVERHTFFEEVCRLGSMVKETKTDFGNNFLAKIKLEDDVQAGSGIKGFNIKSEPVEAAEYSMFYERNGDENNQKNKSDDDVEILDSAEIFKANNLGPFVASKKIHENMGMEDDLQLLGNPSMYSDYRKQILKVLGKPFDKEEYKNLQKMVSTPNRQDLNEDLDEANVNKKSYLDYHPDVKRKLKANRYNQRKRLTILRGFVFWLENVTREGAFKPWLDRECLAVLPKS